MVASAKKAKTRSWGSGNLMDVLKRCSFFKLLSLLPPAGGAIVVEGVRWGRASPTARIPTEDAAF